MGDNSQIPSNNVLRFPGKERQKARAAARTTDNWDHGPSPEESLRVMRAFVAIKNKALRENLTEMLEDASQRRDQVPTPANE